MLTRRVVLLGLILGALAANPLSLRADESYAIRFDGTTDFVTLGQQAAMIGPAWGTTKTASVWVKPEGTPVCTDPLPASCDLIVGDRPRAWGISRGVLEGQDRIWIWNYDGTVAKVGVEYTPGTWVQISLVHAGGVLKAYKDGLLVGTVASGPTPATNGQSLVHVGGAIVNASRNWTFEGEIDELQIWSIVRTDAEIAGSIYAPLTGTESGLAGYYRMTNGSGLAVTDDSGHGWNGTIKDGGGGAPPNGPAAWVSPGMFGGEPPPPNTVPVADPQEIATLEDTPVAITLTGSDADGNPLTYRVVTPPVHGTLSGNAPGVTYTPFPHFNGSDSFTFVVNDGRADSLPATVTLTVAPVNDPPVAVDDPASTTADTPVVVSVLSNDFDVDGDGLVLTSVDDPPNGTVAYDGSQITYTPDAGFLGVDTFGYEITDGQVLVEGTVTVTVTPAGEGPGYALRFDGASDSVALARTAYILWPGWESTKTVELWVKPTGTPFCNIPLAPMCDSIFGDQPRWWGISVGIIDGVHKVMLWNWDGNLDVVAVDYTPGQWIHLAMVHSGGVLSAYKNGVLVGSASSGPTQQPGTQFPGALPVLRLGGIIKNAANNWTFQGDLDEVRLWSTARTSEQIYDKINQPLNGPEFGLSAYYRMSDGSGGTVTDDSGNGWIGTLHDGGLGVPPDGLILWVPSGAFIAP